MKVIFFDAGPLISLIMSNLVGIMPKLKMRYGGKFYITPAVHRELVERPLLIKRFSFEALQVEKLLKEGVLEEFDQVPMKKVKELIYLANQSFTLRNKNIDVMQEGEMESIVAALEVGADALVTDERTLRLFVENSGEMQDLLERRFHEEIVSSRQNISSFSRRLQGMPIIRSAELIGTAFRMGLLDEYIPPQKDGPEVLLNAVLWTLKYNGCAITEEEIEEEMNFLLKEKKS
ncbi:hypothetical protein HYX12_02715 [Candidatus Woesearchaeota archaeon]|nr:hypothetical protein [Candidatus Woesearchaeota archaeon]